MTELQNEMANAIRALSMDAVEKAASGHPGMPMGMADVATVLFSEFLKFDPNRPDWVNRDRFILSAGHGSMLLYSLLYLTGYKDITIEDIKNFRQLHSKTCGHPEFGELAGIETTTGPLGQGIGNAVGMAIAEKLLAARYGKIVEHYTYVIAGDGCLMEGISHEAISLAGNLGLGKLILLFDDNHICIDGSTELTVTDDQPARFKACGWDVCEIDGHDSDAIRVAIAAAQKTDKPSLIACRTTIAKGAPTKAGSSSSHGAPLGESEIEGARKNLNWEHEPFFIPDDILKAWRDVGQKGVEISKKWDKDFASLSKEVQEEFNRELSGELPDNAEDAVLKLKKEFSESSTLASKMATRKSSSLVLKTLTNVIPEMIGGSADLTGSNLTKNNMQHIEKDNFSGSYIYYGVREHAMCAVMNGIALHKGFIPYGGTFFVFTDYCRPSIRLAALMKQRVIYVMTHDSIGLGEDGPTHQPVEHLASFRAMPNVNVLRPADATETLECWQIALNETSTPSILVLTRQGVANVRQEYTKENLSEKGGYVLSDIAGDPSVTLIATGSEVELVLNAQKELQKSGILAKVVSMPCADLFDKQSDEYKKEVLGENTLKVAVEAGISYGWERYIGKDGIFIGMEGFGASAPADQLYEHFGITVENVVERVMACTKRCHPERSEGSHECYSKDPSASLRMTEF